MIDMIDDWCHKKREIERKKKLLNGVGKIWTVLKNGDSYYYW